MKTPDQLEEDSALHLRDMALRHSYVNCKNTEDLNASAIAILHRAIEFITKKEVEICFKKSSSI